MICTRCGNQCPDNTRFCTRCGNDLTIGAGQSSPASYDWNDQQGAGAYDQPMTQPSPASYDQGYAQPSPYDQGYAQQTAYAQPSPEFGWSQLRESKYDATVFETFIAFLVTTLIAGVTLGIATPWATCYLYNFVLSHVIIDGKRLTFDGKGEQLFGNWIKWFVFIVITGGIYGIWVYPRMFEWMAKHTHFAE